MLRTIKNESDGKNTEKIEYGKSFYRNLFCEREVGCKKNIQTQQRLFSGSATIGNKYSYENRDGNVNVKLNRYKTLKRVYKLLLEEKITVNRSKTDSGSHSKEIIVRYQNTANRSISEPTNAASCFYEFCCLYDLDSVF